MNNPSPYRRNKFITGLIALFSMLLVSSASFEANPQDCGMIISNKRKKQ